MKQKDMKQLMRHMDRYFMQKDSTVLHPVADDGFHVDVLLTIVL